MANTCFTIYKIMGTDRKTEAYNKLVSALTELKGERFPWLGTLATLYGLTNNGNKGQRTPHPLFVSFDYLPLRN